MMSNPFNIHKPLFMEKAACIKHPTRWWFPEFGDKKEHIKNTQKAKSICSTCQVKRQCLKFGEKTGSCGIWGGFVLDRGRARVGGKRIAKQSR
jgi:hypothetical protein